MKPSAEGVQQGDPLGPILYCLTVHEHFQQLNSELYIFITVVGDSSYTILNALEIVRDAEKLGRILNSAKSEIITRDPVVCSPISSSLPACMCHSTWITYW